MASDLTRRGMLKASAAAATFAALGTNFAHAAGDDKIRVGLIGCGGRGRGAAINVLDAAKNVEIYALGDLFQDQMDAALDATKDRPKDQWNIDKSRCFVGFDAYKKVLATDVNYVILATPPAFRPMMMKAAAEAGKHVFAEKPIAVDPAGVRTCLEAAKIAEQKSLGIAVGTQRRHQAGYIETIKRIKDGEIGEVVLMQGYWLQGGAWMKPREPQWSDLEWQLRNWPYFTWLAGDHIVEQHMHQHDVMCWIMGGPPKLCIGMGGRQSRTDPAYGHIYDHFTVEYEWANGVRGISMCRQVDSCYYRVGERVAGTKGWSYPMSTIAAIGKEQWRFEGGDENPYVVEHKDLIDSIRAGKPLNEGKQGAESTLTAIMGRMSAYTGKLVTWQMALNSRLSLMPDKLEFGPFPTPAVAIPGSEQML